MGVEWEHAHVHGCSWESATVTCVCVLKRWKREGGGISRDVYVRCRVIAFVIPAKGRVGINRRLKGILICSDLFRKMVK